MSQKEMSFKEIEKDVAFMRRQVIARVAEFPADNDMRALKASFDQSFKAFRGKITEPASWFSAPDRKRQLVMVDYGILQNWTEATYELVVKLRKDKFNRELHQEMRDQLARIAPEIKQEDVFSPSNDLSEHKSNVTEVVEMNEKNIAPKKQKDVSLRGGKREGAGRKPIVDKGVVRKVSVTLPEDVWKWFDGYADLRDISMAAVIRDLMLGEKRRLDI